MTSDRVALHRRIAHAKWETYAKAPEVEKISYGDEWIYAPDAVMMCPLFNDGSESRMADLASEDVLAAMQKFAPTSLAGTGSSIPGSGIRSSI